MGWPDEQPDGGWYPFWMRPVPFPTAAAEAAREACDDAADVLNDDLLARPDMVSSARDGWEGTYRDDFDEEWSSQETALSTLQSDLRTLASTIADAAEAASTINSHRADLRTDYVVLDGPF